VLLDDKLKWAITILRDPTITQLLRKYLGEKLRHLMTAFQSPTLSAAKASFRQSGGKTYAYIFTITYLRKHSTNQNSTKTFCQDLFFKMCTGSPPLPVLPFEDRQCRHVLQLCQLAFMDDITTIHPVSNKILRELVPQVIRIPSERTDDYVYRFNRYFW
jgi:hypothetical protein